MRGKKRLVNPRDITKKIRVNARGRNNQTFRKILLTSFLLASVAGGLATINYIANRSKKEVVQQEDIEKSKEEARIKRMNGGEYGETPSELARLNKDFLSAADKCDAEEVAHLLEIGADANTKTESGSTALMLAAENWWIGDKTIRLLVENGANVNAKNSLGLTPLMIASMRGNTSAVKFLVESGADMDAVDKRGETALDKATRLEFEKTTELLENYKRNQKKKILSL